MMGLEKGEVMGVAGYEVVRKVDLSKPYRFNGANWRDTRMNSLGLALEQSAIYTGMGLCQRRVKKGVKKGVRDEVLVGRGGNLDDGGGGGGA